MQAEDIQRLRQQHELEQQRRVSTQQQQLTRRLNQLLRQVTVDENARVCRTLTQVNELLQQHLRQ